MSSWLYHSTLSFNFTTTSQEQISSFVLNPQVKLCDSSKPYGLYKCQMQVTNHERPTWVKTVLKCEARAQGHTNKDREGKGALLCAKLFQFKYASEETSKWCGAHASKHLQCILQGELRHGSDKFQRLRSKSDLGFCLLDNRYCLNVFRTWWVFLFWDESQIPITREEEEEDEQSQDLRECYGC